MNNLPKCWSEDRLENVGDLVTGNTPSKKKRTYYLNGTIDFVKPADLQNSVVNTYSEKLSEEARRVARIVPKDTVLVTCIGELGRIGYTTKELAFNQQINAIIPSEKINGKFLFYRLQIEREQLNSLASATTVSIVNKSKFGKLTISYPKNKTLQHYIVQEIETQFTRLDSAIKSLKSIKKKLDIYRKSTLKAAFEPFINNLGKFTENVVVLDSKRVPVNKSEREKRKGNVPYYGATGQVGWIDNYLFNEELVLLGEDGAPFLDPFKNKAYLIAGKSWVNNHAHVLRGKNGLLNKFLIHWLNNIDYGSYVGGTTRLKLNQNQMKNIPIPCISTEKQKSVINFIDSPISVIDRLEKVINNSIKKTEYLKKSILKAASKGNLVNYEGGENGRS